MLACIADYFDGVVARRSRAETIAGRLLDNCCDAGFLALAFAGFARAEVWRAAVSGSARTCRALDWLTLLALTASFGTFVARWVAAAVHDTVPRRSARGHHAGIGNYVLALVGGAAVFLPPLLPPFAVGASFVVVTLLNVVAAMDNARLLASGSSDDRPSTGYPKTPAGDMSEP